MPEIDRRTEVIRRRPGNSGPSFIAMHSGSLILIWLAGVASIQGLSSWPLMLVLALCTLAAAALAPDRAWRLVRRVRFLLLAIVVLFAGFTPGEAILADFAEYSPSREGLMLAMVHSARLLAVVLCVAMLIERLPVQRLVGGLFALMQPLQRVGFPAGRAAIRLLLVLRYTESAAPKGWKSWLESGGEEDLDEPITIVGERLGVRDLLALLAAALVLAWVVVPG